MLSEKQILLIRSSAEQIAIQNVMATNAFYSNLFNRVPPVRPLFPTDMFGQSRKLWESIVLVVQSADDLDRIRASLHDLGARHIAFGALPEHYQAVSRTLVETLAGVMGKRWTPAHEDAWNAILNEVCEAMLTGATQHAH